MRVLGQTHPTAATTPPSRPLQKKKKNQEATMRGVCQRHDKVQAANARRLASVRFKFFHHFLIWRRPCSQPAAPGSMLTFTSGLSPSRRLHTRSLVLCTTLCAHTLSVFGCLRGFLFLVVVAVKIDKVTLKFRMIRSDRILYFIFLRAEAAGRGWGGRGGHCVLRCGITPGFDSQLFYCSAGCSSPPPPL